MELDRTTYTYRLTLDLERVAREINESVNDEVETAETINNWISDNGSEHLARSMEEALIEEIGSAYD